jgi:hypothetical protein
LPFWQFDVSLGSTACTMLNYLGFGGTGGGPRPALGISALVKIFSD